MKKEPKKSKTLTETQVLDLLKKVLPKTTADASLAGKIYQAVADELQRKVRANAFEKFCERVELPDLENKTLMDVKQQFEQAFGEAEITFKPNKRDKTLAVEVNLPDAQLHGEIAVNPEAGQENGEPEATLKFLPFPVALPGDKELIWFLGKRENLTHAEAGLALAKLEEEFWNSKPGVKLLRDRVERSFAEFISRAPAGLFNEAGLKRHYKSPEPLKTLRGQPGR